MFASCCSPIVTIGTGRKLMNNKGITLVQQKIFNIPAFCLHVCQAAPHKHYEYGCRNFTQHIKSQWVHELLFRFKFLTVPRWFLYCSLAFFLFCWSWSRCKYCKKGDDRLWWFCLLHHINSHLHVIIAINVPLAGCFIFNRHNMLCLLILSHKLQDARL